MKQFLPWKLSQVYPNQVTVLSDRTFFWPTWTQDHLRAVYDEDEYSFDDSGQLAYVAAAAPFSTLAIIIRKLML